MASETNIQETVRQTAAQREALEAITNLKTGIICPESPETTKAAWKAWRPQ